MPKKKPEPIPTLPERVANAQALLASAYLSLEGIKLERQPAEHWLDDDLDIQAARAALHVADNAIEKAKAIVASVLWQHLDKEQGKRWAVLPAITPEEFEQRVTEQQALPSYLEAFCRHCGKGYGHMNWNPVAEDGSILKDAGQCRCGRNDFVYRKHPDEPEKHGVYRSAPRTQPTTATLPKETPCAPAHNSAATATPSPQATTQPRFSQQRLF